jgi:hypothetical protein
MDAARFDALVRSIDLYAPRRAALGVLGGGLATVLGRFGIDDIAAKKKKKKCKPCRKKKKGKCKGKKPDGTPCGGENVCQNGQCVAPTPACDPPCEAGEECCGNVCIDEFACCTDAECGGDILTCENNVCTCPDPSEIACNVSECCDPATEVCAVTQTPQGTTAECQLGDCPANSDICNDETIFVCDVDCSCVTSVDDVTFCTTGFIDEECTECTADSECEALLGAPGICITGGGICESLCPGVSRFCVTTACESGVPRRANGRRGRSLADSVKSAR